MKGDVKAIHIDLEGTYILNQFDLLNGKPYWRHEKDYEKSIWYSEKDTTWNIGTYNDYYFYEHYEVAIYSIENTVEPLKTKSWAYNDGNGSEFISSTDIVVESGKK